MAYKKKVYEAVIKYEVEPDEDHPETLADERRVITKDNLELGVAFVSTKILSIKLRFVK